MNAPVDLSVWMTRNVGADVWLETGLMDREIGLYARLEGVRTTFFHDQEDVVEHGGFRFVPKTTYPANLSDIVKSNQVDGADSGLASARIRGVPFILRCGYSWATFEQHRPIRRWRKWMAWRSERRLAQSADVCVVSSRKDAGLFTDRYRVPESRVRVHPNWVDTATWVPETRSDPSRIVSVGRLTTQKNHELLIRACAQLSNRRLEIVGAGPLRGELEQLGRELGVDLRILDPVPHDQLREFLRGAGVFVLSSRYEGLPKVVLEAMALGLPVVSTRCDGVEEVIDDGVSGILADDGIESLAAAMGRALGGDGHRIGLKGRERVVSSYSLDHVARLETDLIRELLT